MSRRTEAPTVCPACLGNEVVRVNAPRPSAFGVLKQTVQVPCPRCSAEAADLIAEARRGRA